MLIFSSYPVFVNNLSVSAPPVETPTIQSLSGVSLNAVTATGPGLTLIWSEPKTAVFMQVSVTGSPSNYEVDLEGSIDGIHFFKIASATQSMAAGSSNDQWVVIAARANLVSFSGGSNPTFTASVAAA